MRLIAVIGTAFLSLTIAAPVYAQQEQQQDKPAKEEKHPQQQEKKAQPEKQQPQQEKQRAQQEKPQQEKQRAQQEKPQQDKPAQRDEQRAKDAKPAQQNEHQAQQQNQHPQRQEHAQQQRGNEQPQRTQEQHRVQQSAMQQHRSHSWDSDHRTWQQRGGYNGYRIPDDRFRGYFGQDHGFRISGLPFLIVGGYPRFQYGGYWVSMVDPWPEYWGDDWYDNDDVYVVYVDNGYYLYNNRYPNVGIAINISM
ncbi:MAG TPA: hypothetical protein VNX26_17490 [Candidatus Acidoferrum sp.]|nr:hypothetical protein [Candidatus Acidoferrum sp.]